MRTVTRLRPVVRTDLNNAISDLCRGMHDAIPLAGIQAILERGGMRLEEAILCGRQGNTRFDLFMGDDEVDNSVLVLTWYKHDTTGRYEVVAYLS